MGNYQCFKEPIGLRVGHFSAFDKNFKSVSRPKEHFDSSIQEKKLRLREPVRLKSKSNISSLAIFAH